MRIIKIGDVYINTANVTAIEFATDAPGAPEFAMVWFVGDTDLPRVQLERPADVAALRAALERLGSPAVAPRPELPFTGIEV